MEGTNRKFLTTATWINLAGTLGALAAGWLLVPRKAADIAWGSFQAGFNPPTWLMLVLLGGFLVTTLLAWRIDRTGLGSTWKVFLTRLLTFSYTACLLIPLAMGVAMDVVESARHPELVPWIPTWFGVFLIGLPVFGGAFLFVSTGVGFLFLRR